MFSSYSDEDHNNVGAKHIIIAKPRKEERTSIASFPEPTSMVEDDNSGFYWG